MEEQKDAGSSQVERNNRSAKVKPRMSAEGVMASPASDAATLRHQVAALQLDVEAHIETEHRLQSFNQQLSERLEIYMKQNHENLERAAEEMNTLHQDMEQTLELQRKLSTRASLLEGEKKDLELTLQNHIQLFDVERAFLQKQVMALTMDVQQRADADPEANQLQWELEKAQGMNSTLCQLLERNLGESTELKLKIKDYRNEFQSLLAEEKRTEELERRHKVSLLKSSFKRFINGLAAQHLTLSGKSAADGIYRLACCRRAFGALRLAAKRSRTLHLAKAYQTQALLRDLWKGWRLLTLAQKKHASILKLELLKSLYGWKNLVHGFQNQCGQYADLAAKHWCVGIVKRAFERWTQWILRYSKPTKMKLHEAVVHLHDATCRVVLVGWEKVLLLKGKRQAKLQQALGQRRRWWLKTPFARWQEILKVSKARRVLEEKAICFRRGHSCDLVLRCWEHYAKARRQATDSKTLACKHYRKSLKLKELRLWKQNTEFLKAKSKAAVGFNHALVKTAMEFWIDNHSIKKKRLKKASVHRHRSQLKVLTRMLMIWWEEMVWTRHATEMLYSLASWWQRILLRTAFHSWMHSAFGHALIASSKCQSDLVQAMEKLEHQKHRSSAVDVENLHLIDRLHVMSSEVAYLVTRISAKSKKEVALQRALEDAALIESSMRGDLEQKKCRIVDLEKEALILQKSLHKRNSEDVAGGVYHALHVQSLEHAVTSVQVELSQKQSQVESYEKALKETADKLEGTSDESHKKLDNAFQIAASLRNLLEDRENQYAALEGSCRRRDLELEEIQKKLKMSKTAFISTLDTRDSRISELEKLLMQKQAQIEEVRQDVQDVQLAIGNTKLEYDWQRIREGG